MKLEDALKKVRLGGHRLFFGGTEVATHDDTFSQGDLLSDAWVAVPVPVTFHTAVKALDAVRKPTFRMRRQVDPSRSYYVLDGVFCCVEAGRSKHQAPSLADYVAEDWVLEGDL